MVCALWNMFRSMYIVWHFHPPGNQFGEEGIDTITQLLEGLGREELIGSFSDDEGDEEEEEEAKEEEAEEDKEIGSEEDQEDVSAQDEKLQVKETSVSHEEQSSSHRTEKVYCSMDVVGPVS